MSEGTAHDISVRWLNTIESAKLSFSTRTVSRCHGQDLRPQAETVQ